MACEYHQMLIFFLGSFYSYRVLEHTMENCWIILWLDSLRDGLVLRFTPGCPYSILDNLAWNMCSMYHQYLMLLAIYNMYTSIFNKPIWLNFKIYIVFAEWQSSYIKLQQYLSCRMWMSSKNFEFCLESSSYWSYATWQGWKRWDL